MDRSALQTIIEQALAASAVSNTDVLVKALPGDFKLHSLEPFLDGRFRFRGTMSTSSIDDFLSYATENADSDTQCFIDDEQMSATCFFNLGSTTEPGHADHTAQLKLKTTAPYRAMVNINGRTLSQDDIVEWLEDWNVHVQASDTERNQTDTKKALQAIRKITIAAQSEQTSDKSDFRATRSAMENIEARSSDQLPAGFLFTCTPYEGLGERTFFLRLSVIPQKGEPVLKLRIVQFEREQEQMAEEFKNLLVTGFDHTDVWTFIGQFNAK